MGMIVAGMRLRSTLIILKGIRTGDLEKYNQKAIGFSIIIDRNSSTWKWIAFFSSRLIYAFAIWPAKLLGATSIDFSTVIKNYFNPFFKVDFR
jgi:hypothetical protein